MMTQTTLRDGEAVRRRNMHHAADDSAPLSAGFLIANPRLTFGVSRTKHRVLKISNRERIAIFYSHSHQRKSPPFEKREKWDTRNGAREGVPSTFRFRGSHTYPGNISGTDRPSSQGVE